MAIWSGNELELGKIVGQPDTLRLTRKDRDKHLYICGATGTGKSKFVENLIRQDILNWSKSQSGMLLLDPHGSLYDSVMAWLTWMRPKQPKIIPIDLRQDEWVVAYNLLRHRPGAEPSVVVDGFVQAMAHVWGAQSTDATPRFEMWATNILRTLLDNGLTLIDAELIIHSFAKDVRHALSDDLTDPLAARAWAELDAGRPEKFQEQVESTQNRLNRFLRSPYLRATFGQTEASLDLRRAIDEGWIILVSLASEKGRVTPENASLFGSLLMTDLWRAAQDRGKPKTGHHKPFYVYIDEFQRFVTPTIAENLDEARGFGLHLTMANQFPGQLLVKGDAGKQVHLSVMGNASNKVVFRLQNRQELEPLAEWLFMGSFNPNEIKLSLESTKVMAYEQAWQTSYTSGGSSTTGASYGSSTSYAPRLQGEDGDDERGHVLSDGGSSADGSTWASTVAEVMRPILGKEVSSVQFRSLDEQLHFAMVTLFDQKQRFGTARLAEMRVPVSVQVPDVKTHFVSEMAVTAYRDKLLSGCEFALSKEKAESRLKARQTAVLALAQAHPARHEPVSARRTIVAPILGENSSSAEEPPSARRPQPPSC